MRRRSPRPQLYRQPADDRAEGVEHDRHCEEADRAEDGEREPLCGTRARAEPAGEGEHQYEDEGQKRVAACVRGVLDEHRGAGDEPCTDESSVLVVERSGSDIRRRDEHDPGHEGGEADRPRLGAEDTCRDVRNERVKDVVVRRRVVGEGDVPRRRHVAHERCRLVVAHRLEQELEPDKDCDHGDCQRARPGEVATPWPRRFRDRDGGTRSLSRTMRPTRREAGGGSFVVYKRRERRGRPPLRRREAARRWHRTRSASRRRRRPMQTSRDGTSPT